MDTGYQISTVGFQTKMACDAELAVLSRRNRGASDFVRAGAKFIAATLIRHQDNIAN
jgi:hypothetical protein